MVTDMGAWEIAINSVSAAGSIGASIVALYLARSSDRVRRRERQDEAFAQARLVLVEVVDNPHSPELFAIVHNYSRQPILDLTLRSVLYMPLSVATFVPLRPKGCYVPVLQPGEKQKFAFTFTAPDSDHNVWAGDDPAQMVKDVEDYYAVVRFTDAEDTYWQYSWSVDEVTLTRLAHDYQPKDIVATETERGVRIRRKRMNLVENGPDNPFATRIMSTSKWRRLQRKVCRIGRRPQQSGSSPFNAPT